MKVKAKRQFQHMGLKFEKGHVMDLPENEAQKLMALGHIEEYEAPKSAIYEGGGPKTQS